MKKFTQVFTTVVTIATLVFFGYVAGTNKNTLIKAYNYCRYLVTAQEEETEVMGSGELMNRATNLSTYKLTDETGKLKFQRDGVAFYHTLERIRGMCHAYPGQEFPYYERQGEGTVYYTFDGNSEWIVRYG